MYKIYKDQEGDLFAFIPDMSKYTWIHLGKDTFMPEHPHEVDWFEVHTYSDFQNECEFIIELKSFDDLKQYIAEIELSIMVGAD